MNGGRRLRDEVQRLRDRLPPSPPATPETRTSALKRVVWKRLPPETLGAVCDAYQAMDAGASPDELPEEQAKPLDLYVDIALAVDKVAGELGLDLVAQDDAGRERAGVEAVYRVTGCTLYVLLWRRVWAVESGESGWLPSPSDLTSFCYHPGEPSGVSEERRRREASRMARRFAEQREKLLLGVPGTAPVREEHEAEEIASYLYDRNRGAGRTGQRHRLLDELSTPGSDRAVVLEAHLRAIEEERRTQQQVWGHSQHDPD